MSYEKGIYYILQGKVQIRLNNQKVLNLVKGQEFGEINLMTNQNSQYSYFSQGPQHTYILFLSQQDIINTIKMDANGNQYQDIQQNYDYQYYKQLCDQVSFCPYSNCNEDILQCYFCNEQQHVFEMCPYLQPQFNKEKLLFQNIDQNNSDINEFRYFTNRFKNKKQNTWLNLEAMQDLLINFLTEKIKSLQSYEKQNKINQDEYVFKYFYYKYQREETQFRQDMNTSYEKTEYDKTEYGKTDYQKTNYTYHTNKTGKNIKNNKKKQVVTYQQQEQNMDNLQTNYQFPSQKFLNNKSNMQIEVQDNSLDSPRSYQDTNYIVQQLNQTPRSALSGNLSPQKKIKIQTKPQIRNNERPRSMNNIMYQVSPQINKNERKRSSQPINQNQQQQQQQQQQQLQAEIPFKSQIQSQQLSKQINQRQPEDPLSIPNDQNSLNMDDSYFEDNEEDQKELVIEINSQQTNELTPKQAALFPKNKQNHKKSYEQIDHNYLDIYQEEYEKQRHSQDDQKSEQQKSQRQEQQDRSSSSEEEEDENDEYERYKHQYDDDEDDSDYEDYLKYYGNNGGINHKNNSRQETFTTPLKQAISVYHQDMDNQTVFTLREPTSKTKKTLKTVKTNRTGKYTNRKRLPSKSSYKYQTKSKRYQGESSYRANTSKQFQQFQNTQYTQNTGKQIQKRAKFMSRYDPQKLTNYEKKISQYYSSYYSSKCDTYDFQELESYFSGVKKQQNKFSCTDKFEVMQNYKYYFIHNNFSNLWNLNEQFKSTFTKKQTRTQSKRFSVMSNYINHGVQSIRK